MQKLITLNDIKMPFLIRKRNKGHNEIDSIVSFSALTQVEPFEFLILLFRYSRSLLTYDSFNALVDTLQKDFQLTNFSLSVNFNYLIDRVSVNYSTAPFPLKCEFISKEFKGEQKSGMTISVPIKVTPFYNNSGNMTISLFDSSTLFFEDILDYIVKVGKVKLFPILSSQDFPLLEASLSQDKLPQEYLNLLRGCTLGKHGECIIEVSDFYNMYKLRIKEEW